MTPAEVLSLHQQLCDEIHQLALEENRFLKQQQRAPDAALLERKRVLLARLDESLAALKTCTNAPDEADRPTSAAVEKARARIMQILHLDRENEQLLFRYSLGSGVRAAPMQPPPSSQLQRVYDKYR